MYSFKVGEQVWGNIERSRGGNLPWRKGSVLRRHTNSDGEKIYNIFCLGKGFTVSEKNIVSVASVEAGV